MKPTGYANSRWSEHAMKPSSHGAAISAWTRIIAWWPTRWRPIGMTS